MAPGSNPEWPHWRLCCKLVGVRQHGCSLPAELVGRPFGIFVLVITIISLLSTSIAQIVATSTGMYYLVSRPL